MKLDKHTKNALTAAGDEFVNAYIDSVWDERDGNFSHTELPELRKKAEKIWRKLVYGG